MKAYWYRLKGKVSYEFPGSAEDALEHVAFNRGHIQLP
ncbi:hypothetical protein PsAD26_02529 [Pseudovibrio sp. Ad26]|nr:hypothetical protein PsAD26_02529 [Pseudovibrio sp. Ad26]